MYPYSFIPCGTDLHELRLRNGYSLKSPSCIIKCSLGIGYGREEWGAEPNKEYYILSIHNVHKE